MPEGGLNIRLVDTPIAQEARMIDHKRFAAEAFSHANRMDKRIWGKPGAKVALLRRARTGWTLSMPSIFWALTGARRNGLASPPTRSARHFPWT